jgi:hypothetical protein
MSPAPLFAHPVRDPPGRVSRLYEDLSSLGRQLREGIATLAGRHAGDAVRDAVQTALGHTETDLGLHASSYRPSAGGRDDPYRGPYRDPYAEDAERYGGYREDGDAWSASSREPVPPPSCLARLPAWWSTLPPALQLLSWWLRQRESRPRVATALGVGAAAILAYLTIGPVAGALVASAGTALTLYGLVGGLRDCAGGLSGG